MRLKLRAAQAAGVAQVLVRYPKQARHLHRIPRTIGKHPLETRLPWLAFDVIDWLDANLARDFVVFEYGGGGSTAFFADRVKEVVSVEHDSEWAASLQEAFRDVPNVQVRHIGPDNGYSQYVASIKDRADESFDVVLIDGRERVRCVENAMAKVKPNGYLILDDSQRDRYAHAFELLRGWSREDLHGLSPGKAESGHTTIWTKPLGD